jgi:hypothetical protein
MLISWIVDSGSALLKILSQDPTVNPEENYENVKKGQPTANPRVEVGTSCYTILLAWFILAVSMIHS